MRVIITESQNAILRRYGRIKELFDNYLLVHNVTAFDTFESFFQALCWDIAVDMIDRTKMDQDSYVTLRNQMIQFVKNHFYEDYKEWWERRTNRINENVDKNKKFLTNVMGVDFTGKIEQVTSVYDVPYSFYRKGIFTMPDVASYLNRFGPMYIFELDGRRFIYQDRGRYESFISEDGIVYEDKIPEQLGIDIMGLRFSDIVNMYFNEDDDVITEDEDKMLRNKAQRRMGFIDQHVNELERDDVCEYWTEDEVDDYVDSSMSNIVQQVCEQIGSFDLYNELYEYLVDNGYQSQFRDFFIDTKNNYC
jgi:hypothetical protein